MRSYKVHVINDEVGHAEVPVDQPVDLEVVVVFTERIDQRLRHLHLQDKNIMRFEKGFENSDEKFEEKCNGVGLINDFVIEMMTVITNINIRNFCMLVK